MKNKIVYSSDKDNFIWKMETAYNPIEKLHLKLAKWHLRKLIKVDKEILDKMWLECYDNIIKESLEYPWKEYVLDKDMADKITKRADSFDCAVSCEDIKLGLENVVRALSWDIEPCNAVVKLKGENDESIN